MTLFSLLTEAQNQVKEHRETSDSSSPRLMSRVFDQDALHYIMELTMILWKFDHYMQCILVK